MLFDLLSHQSGSVVGIHVIAFVDIDPSNCYRLLTSASPGFSYRNLGVDHMLVDLLFGGAIEHREGSLVELVGHLIATNDLLKY